MMYLNYLMIANTNYEHFPNIYLFFVWYAGLPVTYNSTNDFDDPV
jgi:hypothetical protein